MDLLPKSGVEFSSKKYWEDFFEKREHAFEWYGEYVDLSLLLDKYCKLSDKILMSGCGNSNLSEEMCDFGYTNIVNIDISDVVLKQMNSKTKGRMPYLKMDIKETTFCANDFSVVIDKGTLDAIYSHDDEKVLVEVEKMFTEILRILKVGGRYICITLAQDHILNGLLSFFPKWCFVRVHQVKVANEHGDGLGSKLPVFVFICTKMKSELTSPVLEMVFFGKDSIDKFKTAEEIKKNIKMLQTFSLVKDKMEHASLHEEVKVDLWSCDESYKEPRYSLYIIDINVNKVIKHHGIFAVFIVANGRENNETFGSTIGRKKIAEAAGFTRLVIAMLHRGHVYEDMDRVKSELSEKVMDLAPSDVDKNVQVPFLSTSSDIGSRNTVYEGRSSLYGAFAVEDVQSEQQFYYRQLVLLKNNDKVLSKTRLMVESSKKKKSKKRNPDRRYLLQSHEKSMLVGFSFLPNLTFTDNMSMNVLIVGLSHTPFINFLIYLFPDLHVTCIDVDSNLQDTYKYWFGLSNFDRFTFIEKDIASFSKECQESDKPIYDVMIIDHLPRKCNQELSDEEELDKKGLYYGGTCDFSEQVLVDMKQSLKTCGVLMRIQRNFTGACKTCMEKTKIPHFESNTASAVVQYIVNHDVNNITIQDVREQAIPRCKHLVDYIMSKKLGFYDKHEWTSLIEVIENLSFI